MDKIKEYLGLIGGILFLLALVAFNIMSFMKEFHFWKIWWNS